jgi:hypothetical protein
VKAYPPGIVIVLPGNTSHFHWAKAGEYIIQITGIGPLGVEYMKCAFERQSMKRPRSSGPRRTVG